MQAHDFGSTGSGKTSTCNVLLRDLIRYKADDKERKIALIIFDFKGDGTLGEIRTLANECGRDTDVLDFSPDGKFYYDPLCAFDSLKKSVLISRKHIGSSYRRGGALLAARFAKAHNMRAGIYTIQV